MNLFWSAVDLFNSSFPVGLSVSLFKSHASSDRCRNAGPLHHLSHTSTSIALNPRLSRSAGLISVGTYLHCSGSVLLWISPTLLATKGLIWRLLPLIHHNTFILSDQNIVRLIGISRTVDIFYVKRTPISADINSNLGILVTTLGATLVLAATMLVDTEASR